MMKEASMYDLDAPLYRHYEYAKRENRLYAEWFRRRGLPYLHFLVLDSVLRWSLPSLPKSTLFPNRP